MDDFDLSLFILVIESDYFKETDKSGYFLHFGFLVQRISVCLINSVEASVSENDTWFII